MNGHYDVKRYGGSGALLGQVQWLTCSHCSYLVNVRALHKSGDKSGAGRYCRARARMVTHLHAEHRDVLQGAVA